MKFKFIIIFIYVYALILTGCQGKSSSYGYEPPINDIHFGMTFDEVSQSLKLSNLSLWKTDELSHTKVLNLKNYDIFGQKGDATLSFYDYETGELNNRFYSITIEFNNPDIKKLVKLLKQKYGSYNFIDENGTELYFWQKDPLSSFKDNVLEKMKIIEISGYKNLTKEQLSYVDITYDKAKNIPLSSIRFFINAEDKETNATLQVEGKYSLLADLALAK